MTVYICSAKPFGSVSRQRICLDRLHLLEVGLTGRCVSHDICNEFLAKHGVDKRRRPLNSVHIRLKNQILVLDDLVEVKGSFWITELLAKLFKEDQGAARMANCIFSCYSLLSDSDLNDMYRR